MQDIKVGLDRHIIMASSESSEYFQSKHYDCITKAHRIACRLLLVFVLSYFLAAGTFWDWNWNRNNSDKHGMEIEYQHQPVNDRKSWALMLEQERQQYARMKENFELKMLQNINQYRKNRTRANMSREVPLQVGPVVSLS